MILENRTLWCAVARIGDSALSIQDALHGADAITTANRKIASLPENVEALRCNLRTPVPYTHDADLLKQCTVSAKGPIYSFGFLCASLRTPSARYLVVFVPFRRMLGGVLRRLASVWQGKNCQWFRVAIMDTVKFFRNQDSGGGEAQAAVKSLLCGLDLHLLGGRGKQEIVFLGMNPAQNRVFEAVTDPTEDFALSPISATFCVPADAGSEKEKVKAKAKEQVNEKEKEKEKDASYISVDRGGVFNVAVDSSMRFLSDMLTMLSDFEQLKTLSGTIDRPIYRSRNAQKRAILRSLSAT